MEGADVAHVAARTPWLAGAAAGSRQGPPGGARVGHGRQTEGQGRAGAGHTPHGHRPTLEAVTTPHRLARVVALARGAALGVQSPAGGTEHRAAETRARRQRCREDGERTC